MRPAIALLLCATLPTTVLAQSPQAPSPMRETTRRHERLAPAEDAGLRRRIDTVLPAPVELFVPDRVLSATVPLRVPLLIHFWGAPWVAQRAVAMRPEPMIVAAVSLGAGSAANGRPFLTDSLAFTRLLAAIEARLAATPGAPRIGPIYLSGWSAGYGALRAIMGRPADAARVAGLLLLDGCHTSYVPEGRVLAEGGTLDTVGLSVFRAAARRAVAGELRFVIVHSEIFPGTYASTTECADDLLEHVGLRRTAVLEWGPVGMQLLSRAGRGGLTVLGFAGNTAPDHVDHLHGMGAFVGMLLEAPRP